MCQMIQEPRMKMRRVSSRVGRKQNIQNQLKEDLEYDQMTLKEYIDPFTGEPVKQSK